MTPRLIQFIVNDIRVPIRLQALCQFPLLFDREEGIALNSNDESWVIR